MKRTWRQQFKSALAGMVLGILVPTLAMGQATLLPNAKQQYLNDAAQPVASGHVDYYIPNTSTRKTVWSDAAKTTPLPNPVILDAAGRPQPTGQIYGDGSYRQRVVDENGVTIWDAVTSSTGSSSGGAVAASEGVMVGTIIPWANTTLPAKYLYTAGQAISRTTYAQLFTAITYQTTILCQIGVATVTVSTAISDAVPLGAPIEFSCFAPGTTVLAKASGSLTMSTNATATTSVSGSILPWGNGDGSTTFNVPDLRGRTFVGRNNMNNSVGSALSSLYYRNGGTAVDPNAVNAVAGGQSGTLLVSNIPNGVAATGSNSISVASTVSGIPTNAVAFSGQRTDGAATGIVGPGGGVTPVTVGTVTSINASQSITVSTSGGGGIAATATVGAGGSGYTAGTQLLTVSGGTCTTQPQFNVTIAAGAITAPVMLTPGLCSVTPTNPAATTGGGGTGGTLNVTYTAAPLSLVQPSVTADYIIKALPDDSPSTPGVTSLGGMTGAIACGTGLSCTANTISVNLGPASVSNTQLAQMPPSTVKMNPTASTAAPVDATIDSLTALPVPDPNLDFLFIHDNATNQIKKVNPSQLVTGLGAGVTSLDGVAGALGVGTGSTKVIGTALTTNVFASRTYAATLNLTGYSVIKTLGYATAGDGGGATFKNVGSTAFRDSFITGITLTTNGTSGCTNGSYLGKQPTGGSGTNFMVNATVAGNVVTAVTIEDTGGNGYTVGNVLTVPSITGCAGAVTVTVSSVSTPTGSFTDSAGTRWQIIPDEGNFINVRQFGAKVDYAGVDASATNDYQAIQNAYSYASDIHAPTIDGGGSAGARVIHPAGNSLVCGSVPLLVPQGVAVEGANMWASTLKMCAAWAASAHFMVICDPDTHTSCFASYLRNLTLYSPFSQVGNSGVSMIYSNNIQQVDIIDRVAVYAGRRRCLTLETGYGGAALLGIQNFECTPGDTSTVNVGIFINYGTTLVNMRNVHVETGGPNTHSGMTITGGFVTVNGFHTENIVTGIEVNITGSIANGFVRLYDLTGGSNCTNLVLKQGGSVANSVYVSGLTQNGCTNSMNNGGVLTTTFIGAWTLF